MKKWFALLTVLVSGCATVAPLDDATVVGVTLASADDLARYGKAQELRSREMFAGASFSDGKGNIRVSFTADQYDEFQTYLRNNPDLRASPDLRPQPSWPLLRLAFQSHHNLYLDADDGSSLTVQFNLCDDNSSERRLYGFGMPQLMWHGRFVTTRQAPILEEARKIEGRPQEYEVFFSYVYWDNKQLRKAEEPITLLPLPGDVCVALHRYNYPFRSSVGQPMRISKNLIHAAIGPLPRTISASGRKTN